MNAKDERRGLIPVTIAAIVLAIGLSFMWSDLRDDTLGHGDDMVTSAVVSRAGATLILPGQPPSHLVVPQTVPASESSTVGRAVH